MKMSQERYDEIKNGIATVVNHFGKNKVLENYKEKTITYMMWALLNATTYDFMYDDNHPAFVRGRTRINTHKPQWNLYNDDLNNKHIVTALKKIAKELGLTKE